MKPTKKFQTVANEDMKRIMLQLRQRLQIHCSRDDRYGIRADNLGNQLEHIAWLALETDKPAIALALAWHSRKFSASNSGRLCQRSCCFE